MRSSVLIVVVFPMLLCGNSLARCRDAEPGQIPHGANEVVVLREQTVARLDGTVFHANGELAGDVVVEIYPYEASAEETARFVKDATRIAACVTSADGGFTFDLTPGRYLLRAGTVQSAGINEIHAIFQVTGSGKRRKVKIRLSMGT